MLEVCPKLDELSISHVHREDNSCADWVMRRIRDRGSDVFYPVGSPSQLCRMVQADADDICCEKLLTAGQRAF